MLEFGSSSDKKNEQQNYRLQKCPDVQVPLKYCDNSYLVIVGSGNLKYWFICVGLLLVSLQLQGCTLRLFEPFHAIFKIWNTCYQCDQQPFQLVYSCIIVDLAQLL